MTAPSSRDRHVDILSPHGFSRMHYYEWGDPANRRVVICVHGLTRNGRDFDALASELATDFRVVCPDIPGRGKSDWLFFFRPGDWLTRMNDDALLGVVVRVEKSHAFTDGSHGPAYVVQSMEGEERVVDADELERTARLR